MIRDYLQWLENTAVATAVRESDWVFPTIETIHVLAVAIVVGSIVRVDLRLIGTANRGGSVRVLLGEMLPWTWTSFVIAVASGALLFSSAAIRYSTNAFFLLKMVTLLLAGLNMVIFHLVSYQAAARPDRESMGRGAQAAGALSLLFWVGIVAFGRWIGFS